jgi:hypothetical protein
MTAEDKTKTLAQFWIRAAFLDDVTWAPQTNVPGYISDMLLELEELARRNQFAELADLLRSVGLEASNLSPPARLQAEAV